jgi:eukaryotic-like serine/threonine-protein kinase
MVFVVTEGGTLDAVRAKTGERVWQFDLGEAGPGVAAPAVAGAVVYAASLSGTIYAMNAGTGKKLWSLDYGEPVLSSPVVANGVLYLGNGSYGIDAFGVR